MLQWGRDFNVAESVGKGSLVCLCIHSFNGAATLNVAESLIGSILCPTHTLLQWGRDFNVAERWSW